MLRQAYLINIDLKMDKGKIAVQTAHGAIIYMQAVNARCCDTDMEERFHDWKSETQDDPIGMMKKVVLKSTESEIRDIFMKLKSLNIWAYLIHDKGLTQLASNSLTCLVVEPLEDAQYDAIFGHLKLL